MQTLTRIGLKRRWDFQLPAMFLFFFSLLGIIYPVAWLLAVLGAILLLVKTGLEIDSTEQRIRRVRELLGMRWGKWHAIEKAERIVLRYEKPTTGHAAEFSIGASSNPKNRTFELLLIAGSTSQRVYEFLDYSYALEVVQSLRGTVSIPIEDEFEVIRQRAANRSRR